MNWENAESARGAIDKAQSILEENNFAGNDGYWGGGKCDWFVIGGRRSGEFSGLSFQGDFHDEVLRLLRSKEPNGEERSFVADADCKKYADEIQKLWLNRGGKNINPYARDNYDFEGCEDDAVILTAELVETLKKKYPDSTEYYDSDAFEEKSISSLSKEDVGAWLVVVDYHF
jgi:hypothetical protein